MKSSNSGQDNLVSVQPNKFPSSRVEQGTVWEAADHQGKREACQQ